MKLQIVSLAISLSILFVLIYFSNISEISSVLIMANPVYIIFALFISLFLMTLRTFRWKVLLRRLNVNLNFRGLFPVFMSGLFISNITPAKSGDPIRSYFLKKRTGISFSKTLPSVVIERIFDVLILIVMSVLGLVFVKLAWEVQSILGIVVLVYAVLIVFIIWLSLKGGRINWFFRLFYKVIESLPRIKKLERRVESMALDFKRSFVKYKNLKIVSAGIFLSAIIWVLEGIIIYYSFLAIGLSPGLLLCVFIIAIAALVGVASSLPGGLGSSEVVMVLLFTSVLSIPFPVATGGVILARFLTYWLNVIIGAMYFRV